MGPNLFECPPSPSNPIASLPSVLSFSLLQHLLGALALHGGGKQRNVSLNLWDTLRRTFIMMHRSDLVELSNTYDIERFRPHFEF